MKTEIYARLGILENVEGALKVIGQVADEFKVSNRTLRFYDQIGLVTPIRKNGIRFYSDADRERIADILKYQQAGMSLKQIKNLFEDDLASLKETAFSRADIKGMVDRLRVRRDEINDAIQEFEALLTRECAAMAHQSALETETTK